MENLRLQEDLLKEYRAEKVMVANQLELLEPLAVSLRKPIAARVLNSIVLLFFEALSWLGIATVIGFCIIRDKVYPFYILARLRTKAAELGFSNSDVDAVYWSVLIFAAIIIILLFIVARNLGKIRKKNAVLQLAAKSIKTVVGEQLNRKAAIKVIDQRYFEILEPLPIIEAKNDGTNEPNFGL